MAQGQTNKYVIPLAIELNRIDFRFCGATCIVRMYNAHRVMEQFVYSLNTYFCFFKILIL